MADCSKTLEYSKEVYRMCKHYPNCYDCPLGDINLSCGVDHITQENIDIVQKWSDKHPEIKPCPFCGNTTKDSVLVKKQGNQDFYRVECSLVHNGCGASTAWCITSHRAWELWNKRNERVDVE